MTAVVTDRIRVPWLWGGARKVEVSIIPPVIALPVLLRVAAFHFLLGVLVLTVSPGLVLWYYYFTHRTKGRTHFFLSLALFSLLYMYYLFITEVLPSGDVGGDQVAVVTAGVTLTLLALVHTKRGPGFVQAGREPVRSTVVCPGPLADIPPGVGTHDAMAATSRVPPSEREGAEGSPGKNWCPVCRVLQPPRAGHCRMCGVCVLRLDHHCVWFVPNSYSSCGVCFLLCLARWSYLSSLCNTVKERPILHCMFVHV